MTDDLSATIDRLEKVRDNEYFALHPPMAVVRRSDLAALLSAIEEARVALGPFAKGMGAVEAARTPEGHLALSFTSDDFRAARAAFERLGGKL